MSMQGTWVHNIIQVVTDAMNLRVHIIESNKIFSDMTLVEPSNRISEAEQSTEKLFPVTMSSCFELLTRNIKNPYPGDLVT